MDIIIDSSIPYIRLFAERIGACTFLPASEITPEAVREADALIVRTRTRCDRSLLEGSRVQFVATATIGFDHLDTEYLDRQGIAWTNCPGCNASSVAQYVHGVLLRLALAGLLRLDGSTTIGIVGVGHVGTLVNNLCRRLGLRTLLCDPPRQMRGEKGFSPIGDVMQEADVITFHVPLERDGAHPTYHMAGDTFFEELRNNSRCPVIVNSSRGEVVDTPSLIRALDDGAVRAAAIDTWEDEPNISTALLQRAILATPHIAGYSADGKAHATKMSLEALALHFGLKETFKVLPPPLPPDYCYRPFGFEDSFAAHCPVPEGLQFHPLLRFDPLRDTIVLKHHPESFEAMRSRYPLRRE